MWGGKKRLYSATKFILYTAGGFIFLLMGVLGVSLYGSNEPTLNFETSVNQSYLVALEIIFYIGFFIAFAVKLPILPLHTWLPDTHGEAHYSTCHWRSCPHEAGVTSELNNLRNDLSSAQLVNRADTWESSLDKDGAFKVCDLRWKVDCQSGITQNIPTIKWSKEVPIKVNCFLWRAIQQRIASMVSLRARGIGTQTTLCGACINGAAYIISHSIALVNCSDLLQIGGGVLK
ncbi:unnamed protein product [Lactuca virosa]|uniref:Reverse transcriptase zinc-binding domain-containing protein n=1 Tax=Lactuca virosa TaxID=75947 RepID=A0AAU9N3J2_9ASTR|nr:unnamed protein product [Lactuca virosa]